MTDMDALFILYWRTTTNQFLFIYPPVRLNMRHWRIILHLFFIKSCDFFVSIFSFFFYYFYMHMYVKSPAHSLTHSPVVPKMKKKQNRRQSRARNQKCQGVLVTGEVKCLFAITAATARALLPICSARSPHGCCGAQLPNSSPRLKLNFTRSCNLLQLWCLEWEVSDLWTQICCRLRICGSGLLSLLFKSEIVGSETADV